MKYAWPALLWMSCIWIFSSDLFSANHTASIIEVFLHWAFPTLSQTFVHAVHVAFRKCAHMSAYAALSYTYFVWFSASYSLKMFRTGFLVTAWVLVLVVIWASIDEIHQTYSLVRTGTYVDVAWDSMGAVLFFFFLDNN